MEWIAHCTVCGELDRAPNGPMMEATARLHRRDTGHMTIVGYEPSIVMSGEMVEVPLEKKESDRPFPQTYGDWVNLAENIKQADPSDVFRVNTALESISHDDPTADEDKRWLVKKAGELGIK